MASATNPQQEITWEQRSIIDAKYPTILFIKGKNNDQNWISGDDLTRYNIPQFHIISVHTPNVFNLECLKQNQVYCFDFDGTLTTDERPIQKIDGLTFRKNAIKTLEKLAKQGYPIVIASNNVKIFDLIQNLVKEGKIPEKILTNLIVLKRNLTQSYQYCKTSLVQAYLDFAGITADNKVEITFVDDSQVYQKNLENLEDKRINGKIKFFLQDLNQPLVNVFSDIQQTQAEETIYETLVFPEAPNINPKNINKLLDLLPFIKYKNNQLILNNFKIDYHLDSKDIVDQTIGTIIENYLNNLNNLNNIKEETKTIFEAATNGNIDLNAINQITEKLLIDTSNNQIKITYPNNNAINFYNSCKKLIENTKNLSPEQKKSLKDFTIKLHVYFPIAKANFIVQNPDLELNLTDSELNQLQDLSGGFYLTQDKKNPNELVRKDVSESTKTQAKNALKKYNEIKLNQPLKSILKTSNQTNSAKK